ncbi:hypothetical protein AKJ50_02025 [candidate division MSBL1 archaeon SCGC-AAA382A13]|uniref:Peptidase M24 domain-containing protein n=1 Tax=candidate division MSBL1 archaeon SCGC-AAA382A13 TaxID=1698279 RepID=A0A133VE89_9EURY|nr:hypothetical protein AKJ50_02025 [candidate division MSBL1 archaeon SCGC-AAA382A13]
MSPVLLFRIKPLKENMIISLETYADFPGIGSMPVEDGFRVTKTGSERLTSTPREIIRSH